MAGESLRLWDPLVRLFHLSIAGVFVANYFFNEAGDDWHVWLGYYAMAGWRGRMGIVGWAIRPGLVAGATGVGVRRTAQCALVGFLAIACATQCPCAYGV